MREGLWVEPAVSEWRRRSRERVGGVADRIKWVGGVSDEAMNKAESAMRR